jgi:hypothetical protein
VINVLAVTMGEERPIARSIATPWQLMSFERRVYPVSDGRGLEVQSG